MSNAPFSTDTNSLGVYPSAEYPDYAMMMMTKTAGLDGVEDDTDDYDIDDPNGGGKLSGGGANNSVAAVTASSASSTTLGDRATLVGTHSAPGSVQADKKGKVGGGGEEDDKEEQEEDGAEEEEAAAAFRGDVEAELQRSCETIQSCLQDLAGELVHYYHVSLQVKNMFDRIMEAESAESERLDQLEPQVLRLKLLVQNSAATSAPPTALGSTFGDARGGPNPIRSAAPVAKKSKNQDK
jgi:hypothetical protein